MALGQQSFAVRQAVGEWAEKSVVNYFATTPSAGILAYPYGERWGGPRRKDTDAANRPDLLLLERPVVKSLRAKGVDLNSLDLLSLPDSDSAMERIVRNALVALEVKISFRYYEKGHVNFIIDEVRRARYHKWLSQTEHVGDVVAWFTLDRAFLAPMDEVLGKGKKGVRSYENYGRTKRDKETWNYPVEGSPVFCTISNVDLNKTLRAVMKRGKTGGVSFSIVDDLAVLENVDLDTLRALAKKTER